MLGKEGSRRKGAREKKKKREPSPICHMTVGHEENAQSDRKLVGGHALHDSCQVSMPAKQPAGWVLVGTPKPR